LSFTLAFPKNAYWDIVQIKEYFLVMGANFILEVMGPNFYVQQRPIVLLVNTTHRYSKKRLSSQLRRGTNAVPLRFYCPGQSNAALPLSRRAPIRKE
jgi:hypothetical protein